MKVVNRKEFLKLPPYTIFAKFDTSGCFGHLSIKGETWVENDYMRVEIANSVVFSSPDETDWVLNEAEKQAISKGASDELKTDFTEWERDAFYEDDMLFCVYNILEIKQLISILGGVAGIA